MWSRRLHANDDDINERIEITRICNPPSTHRQQQQQQQSLDLCQLIAELEERPVLYDRSLHYSAFGRSEVLRSWSEVAEQLGAGRTECLRAWKRLLQTFVCLQQTSERLLAQWPFYVRMRFVEAYAKTDELVMYDDLDHIDEHIDHSTSDDNILIDEGSDTEDTTLQQPMVTGEGSTPSDTDGDEFNDHTATVNVIDSIQQQQQQQPAQALPPLALIKREAEFILPSLAPDTKTIVSPAIPADVKAFDESLGNDEQFLLSFAPNLTRLSARQNAFARLRILEELYKLEFE